jgi:putative N6-adenine-specific DNA methylase
MLNHPKEGEIRELEKDTRISDFSKKYEGYAGIHLYEFCPGRVGLRTKRQIPFYNGEIECRLLEYELYEGSKKTDRFNTV